MNQRKFRKAFKKRAEDHVGDDKKNAASITERRIELLDGIRCKSCKSERIYICSCPAKYVSASVRVVLVPLLRNSRSKDNFAQPLADGRGTVVPK